MTAMKIILASGLAATLAACETTSLPVSDLATPTESIAGSAIAFQATKSKCMFIDIKLRPLLADGMVGKPTNLQIAGVKQTFNAKAYVADGTTTYFKALAPATYVIADVTCTIGSGGTTTRQSEDTVYGRVTVGAGETVYIGNLFADPNFNTGAFDFDVKDQKDAAIEAYKNLNADPNNKIVTRIVSMGPTPL